MPVTGTGLLGEPLGKLRALVAASATFRAVVGSASATAALDHVYLQLAEDEEEENRPSYDKKLKHPRPRAIVATAEDWQRERVGVAEWKPTGSFVLTFEFVTPAEYRENYNDTCLWFLNQIGAILSEMETARDADTAGSYLPFHRLACIQDPMPSDESANIEHFWGVEYQVFYL